MKKSFIHLSICLLLTAQAALAQNVKMRDENFKKALIEQGVDLNDDGEIQVSEALKVTKLYVNKFHINNLYGIKSFANLEEFGFYDNEIRDADLSGMTKLRAVYGWNNQLQSLNVKGCTNLVTLYAPYNKLSAIDLSGLPKLKELQLNNNTINVGDVSGHPLLEECQLNDNMMTSFRFKGSNAIKKLRLDNNLLEELNATPLKDLEELSVYKNRTMTVLKIYGLRKLKELSADFCSLNNLNMSGTVNLTKFTW
ncbi:leucine-rich repeat domain-containing protein [Chitinophaga varians]|uniref:leucine-rich repeat domain-containing protein n=1 Tax=Chitinophaga varians TaxID=2202339 RepID=UPI00165FE612|nr:hypothetical protein [Chitinophaga varians]MBC9914976.1 hypothetical protein [Chitinophaga varians]